MIYVFDECINANKTNHLIFSTVKVPTCNNIKVFISFRLNVVAYIHYNISFDALSIFCLSSEIEPRTLNSVQTCNGNFILWKLIKINIYFGNSYV
ncbi:hypothetical protein KFK09_020327 [Dendrobium nobile]|uniref:Uncharacterized protein n=1 Tax=Dendrobium nobile TaxID=94219 RepID=A0A8T3ATP7_DENNO|nr:hypothetical protein KFK09_020327 [Dendrobium nobile]